MNISVSIITPSYNQGKFIERTLQSVLSEQIPNLEYIVVDGGSTDNTVDILKKYSDRVRWTSEKDNGQSDAINKGIKLSHGEIIGWLNSDDIYYPNAISLVIKYFNENPDVDLVYGLSDYIDANDKIIGAYPTENSDFDRLLSHCYLAQPATFFRRSVVRRAGLIDINLSYCMDYEYWIRLAKLKIKFAYLPNKLAGSRMYPETKTVGFRLEAHREIKRMFKQKLNYVPDRWLVNYAHVFLEEKFFFKKFFSKKNRARSNIISLYFTLGIFMVVCFESKKWNNKISEDVLKLTKQWIKDRIFLILNR